MKVLSNIYRNKPLHLAVLFLYMLLFICISFHYHDINLTTNETQKVFDLSVQTSPDKNISDCEICHIISTYTHFNPAPAENDDSIVSNDFIVLLNSDLTSSNLYLFSDLRAPPAS